MKKALVTASVWGFIGSFEKKDIQILKSMGCQVYCAANRFSDVEEFGDKGQLDDMDIVKCQIDYSRFPFSRKNFIAYKQIKQLLKENKFDIIHCHTPIAGILTRIAARKYRKSGTKVIYTAHGFHFFGGSPKKNWLLYYPVEKLCSRFTDTLITINKEDYALARAEMKAEKICYVPGIGVDIEKFSSVTIDKHLKREELGVPEKAVLLFSVGELNVNKNHQTVIRALADIRNSNVYYMIAGSGDKSDELKQLAKDLNIDDHVLFLGYRMDVAELYRVSDIFVFPSYREGLSVSLMEAMACGLPVICSKIRGNVDLIDEDTGGMHFVPSSCSELENALCSLINDENKRMFMGSYNVEKIQGFSSSVVQSLMEKVYSGEEK
ncbi:MAG: glycosyltransferase family 4 protein [Oscillospiraceae bacterium]|nr:glycosyltransferase family 4 protein [Oscillospiraceae bacterium]